MGTLAEDRRERLARTRLYVITDDNGDFEQTLALVTAALEGGADIIQLRKKTMPKDAQFRLAVRLRDLTGAHGALLIINDHPDLAIVADADGVHLGQDDFPAAMIRRLHGFEGRLLGRSTHSLDQALAAARDGVDYLGVGPIYATPTKPGRPAVGCELVRAVADNVDRPFVAIGGIDLRTAPAVIAAGARAIAVVRAVSEAADPREAARKLRQLVEVGQPAVRA